MCYTGEKCKQEMKWRVKYIVILADGMADEPIPELNHKTPLQYAHTPHIDGLAPRSTIGMVRTIPRNLAPGSDVANLSVMGYDPAIYYTGRSPLEAVSMGVDLSPHDLALRCNLVTLSETPVYTNRTMVDYSAGEIPSNESSLLIKTLQDELGNQDFHFHPGISYRHLLVWKDGAERNMSLIPPHDISGRPIGKYLPGGQDGHILLDFMEKSARILSSHPINLAREKTGEKPANSVWFWGEGVRPSLTTFKERYGLNGSVVAAVDLIKGLGKCAGLNPVKVAGATGGVKTNFYGKAQAALEELKKGQDFVYIHIESPDESGHQGNLASKIWSIEQIDKLVVAPIINAIPALEPVRIMLLPDHPTPLSIMTHSSEPVPFLIYDSRQEDTNSPGEYNEAAAAQGPFVEPGHTLMDLFIHK